MPVQYHCSSCSTSRNNLNDQPITALKISGNHGALFIFEHQNSLSNGTHTGVNFFALLLSRATCICIHLAFTTVRLKYTKNYTCSAGQVPAHFLCVEIEQNILFSVPSQTFCSLQTSDLFLSDKSFINISHSKYCINATFLAILCI